MKKMKKKTKKRKRKRKMTIRTLKKAKIREKYIAKLYQIKI
jgi:hypothetical protein